ncbi:hypothetical protein QC762_0001950 [Podospora pseudocomata]|uniref:Uncharacterized protein n=1 Tax=Podospora pseudocomata TaxID=2093779 RepID=A0ABR0GSV7_9PEZI|nr:hypothetical protein QC762_0001950 [Podospora pseudocomata]
MFTIRQTHDFGPQSTYIGIDNDNGSICKKTLAEQSKRVELESVRSAGERPWGKRRHGKTPILPADVLSKHLMLRGAEAQHDIQVDLELNE